jgi:hypothetical protein
VSRRAAIALALAALPALTTASLSTTSAAFSGQTEAEAVFTAAPVFCETPGTVTLQASADATIRQEQPNVNYGAALEAHVQSLTNGNRWALIQFPLPARGHCTVVRAVLRVHALSIVAGRTIDIHRLGSAWNEATVTWNVRPTGSGSFIPATASHLGWNEKEVTSLVAEMYASGNHGFGLKDANENSLLPRLQVYSSREGVAAPELVLTLG